MQLGFLSFGAAAFLPLAATSRCGIPQEQILGWAILTNGADSSGKQIASEVRFLVFTNAELPIIFFENTNRMGPDSENRAFSINRTRAMGLFPGGNLPWQRVLSTRHF
jgi:hypothetical protein